MRSLYYDLYGRKVDNPAFPNVDNRLMSLQLVEGALTAAAMFTAEGEVVQPSEVLYKKPILVERGSFRPATKLTLDLLNRALEQFLLEPSVRGQQPVVLAEYLAGYSDGLIGIAVGLPTVRQVADEKYYTGLPGGVLESAGRLFKRSVKMYVYPTRDPVSGQIQTLEQGPVSPPWHHLRDILLEIGRVEPIRGYDESYLSIRPPDVLARIQRGDPSWEQMVPAAVAEIIKAENLFGWQSAQAMST